LEDDNIFDINKVLQNSFIFVKDASKEKDIEIIFEMCPTLPRKLRGDAKVLEKLLTNILTFVIKYTKKSEIVLSLDAPSDFLYEESVSFKMRDIGIDKEKTLAFLEEETNTPLGVLDGKIVHDQNDIHLSMPFIISELGFRRHYRLPSRDMLQKKVLLIIESENVTESIMKMFKYFPYDVDIGFKSFEETSTALMQYDVVLIEENLVTDTFVSMLQEVKKEKDLKDVLLVDTYKEKCKSFCSYLEKPVTQESIFELIISLFETEHMLKELASESNMQGLLEQNESSSLSNVIAKNKSKQLDVLNTQLGMKNTQKLGVEYRDELEKFVEMFDESDLYFRKIVNEKANHKIKEFCKDLEKQSKIIGAESMQKFADIVSLIFVYDKLDMLPIYPGRFYLELDKLIVSIKRYLYV